MLDGESDVYSVEEEEEEATESLRVGLLSLLTGGENRASALGSVPLGEEKEAIGRTYWLVFFSFK